MIGKQDSDLEFSIVSWIGFSNDLELVAINQLGYSGPTDSPVGLLRSNGFTSWVNLVDQINQLG
jgi:hypothetical protein